MQYSIPGLEDYGLRYFCQIGKLSKNFKAKSSTIVKKKIWADSHTVQLSKKAHSHPVQLSKRNYRSQPPRTIVKLHFGMIFAGKHT